LFILQWTHFLCNLKLLLFTSSVYIVIVSIYVIVRLLFFLYFIILLIYIFFTIYYLIMIYTSKLLWSYSLPLNSNLIYNSFIYNWNITLRWWIHLVVTYLFFFVIIYLSFSFLMNSFLNLFWFQLNYRLLMILGSLVILIYCV
jgi:hypothetical protein